nr:hypothetical protein Iba_chr06aCG6150 [Ipomoea batatas]
MHCCLVRTSLDEKSTATSDGDLGTGAFNAVAINNTTYSRSLFPSTPILKKYSAAEASFGTSAITIALSLFATSDNSSATSENGSNCSWDKDNRKIIAWKSITSVRDNCK